MQRAFHWTLVGLLCLIGACDLRKKDETPPPNSQPLTTADGKNPVVIIETSKGKIKAELFADKAPISVANFLKYVDEKHYDGTIFHRVIPDFMIQGGGMLPNKQEKQTHKPIKNESNNGLLNVKGTLAMARTNVADSTTSQFFINVKDNDFLNRAKAQDGVGYAVFGKVLDGMNVVEAIRNVATGPNDWPISDVVIKSIRRAE